MASNNQPGFEGGVRDDATRRALFEVRRSMVSDADALADAIVRIAALEAESTAREVKGYAANTSGQGPITTMVDLTGVTVTWTAVTGRYYRTSFHGSYYTSAATDDFEFSITDGSNNRKQSVPISQASSGESSFVSGSVVESGLTGSQTRKVRCQRTAGAGDLATNGAADYPFYILVEDLGPT